MRLYILYVCVFIMRYMRRRKMYKYVVAVYIFQSCVIDEMILTSTNEFSFYYKLFPCSFSCPFYLVSIFFSFPFSCFPAFGLFDYISLPYFSLNSAIIFFIVNEGRGEGRR